ncbi:hypothetical protein PoB_000036500 [Plakobranchus ocellatus]|uniref:Uncharacterized protein n=1 Tax=Plakobranchus ocellatus TaxID=259542 RepID=A0AAV3XSG2_9GAST|nr:hypothetical protein PoB_000036500 [Plakobranchus ocellatus]
MVLRSLALPTIWRLLPLLTGPLPACAARCLKIRYISRTHSSTRQANFFMEKCGWRSDPGLSNRDICAPFNQFLSDDQKTNMVTQKGVAGLQKANRTRGENKLYFYPGQVLHTKCRHDCCNVYVIKRDLSTKREQWSPSKKANLRSSTTFDFANDCLLCGRSTRDQRKKGDVSVYQVRTSSCQANLELLFLQRDPGDKWAKTVKGRIEYAQDLHAAEAVYHQQCNINFSAGRNIPLAFQAHGSEGKIKKGRPEDEDRHTAFSKVISFLKENDNEQLTVGGLCQKMQEYLGGEEPYSKEYMKKKLMKTLDSDIVITNNQGKDSVVTIRMTAEKILDQFWKQQKESETSTEKFRIIHTAAKLILATVRDIQYHQPKMQLISGVHVEWLDLPSDLIQKRFAVPGKNIS